MGRGSRSQCFGADCEMTFSPGLALQDKTQRRSRAGYRRLGYFVSACCVRLVVKIFTDFLDFVEKEICTKLRKFDEG